MIRFKNVRFQRSVQVLAKKSDWWTTDEGAEIWLDEADHVWIGVGSFTKLVSGVPYDAEVFADDAPVAPSQLDAKKSRAKKPEAVDAA